MESYRTVKTQGEAFLIEKKSKFIASVSPVQTEDEAIMFIHGIKRQNATATHNCYAYCVTESNGTMIARFSDDGEPQGSAGLPILNVLTGEKIRNAVIVVTRYFGGTLLGVGGLVKAYGQSAKDGLYNSIIIEKNLFADISIICDYSSLGKIQYECKKNNCYIVGTEFTDKVSITLYIEKECASGIIEILKDATNAAAPIRIMNEFFGYRDNDIIVS